MPVGANHISLATEPVDAIVTEPSGEAVVLVGRTTLAIEVVV